MILDIRSVTKTFGGLTAVNDVTFGVERGEIAGIIGPNGAGKTTLFNVITGLYTPDKGDIHFDGEKMNGLAPHEITSCGIARTFQNIRLFTELSSLANIMTARHPRTRSGLFDAFVRSARQRREEAEGAERGLELLSLLELDHVAHERAGDISYGQQRRLEIARALATEPKLLLLDEPAAGMNETESRTLVRLIRHLHEYLDVTVLLIEHDMQVVLSLCDHIGVINFGQKIADGSPQEVRANPDVIEAYLGKGA